MNRRGLTRLRRPGRWPVREAMADLAPAFVVGAAVLVASLVFILPDPQVFPMGDSYIHFVYARNLHNLGEFTYNPGIQEGIGTTSPLWVWLLAAFMAVGIGPLISARALGIGLLITLGVVCSSLALEFLRPLDPRRRRVIALGLGLSCALSGNILWISLSGMETILFLTLGLLALWAYKRERWILTGVSLGLLAVTRIEGLCLAGVLIGIEIVRRRRLSVQIFKMAVPVCLFVLPWTTYLYLHEGAPVPTSYQGKLVTAREVGRLLVERVPWAGWILNAPPLVYMGSWLGYASLYLFGGVSLPGPSVRSPAIWEGAAQSVSVTGAVVAGLIFIGFMGLGWRAWQERLPISLSNANHRWVVAVVAWSLLHNLAYAIWLPQPGAAGRYAPMNHLLFWSGLVAAAVCLRPRWIRLGIASTLVVLLASSLGYWHAVYRANVEYTRDVRIAAAQYADLNCPADKPIGATDLGPIRYFARQRVVDLLGFVNRNIPRLSGEPDGIANYLLEQDVRCLYAFMPVDNVGIDSVALLGAEDHPDLTLHEQASFGAPLEDWILGASPVGNYMPAISVFKLMATPDVDGLDPASQPLPGAPG